MVRVSKVIVGIPGISGAGGGLSQETADTLYVGKPASPDPGDVLAVTSGGEVSNVRPGRIDARVRGLSSANSEAANKTILDNLATESGTDGSELWIPEGVYPARMTMATAKGRAAGTGTLFSTTAAASIVEVTADDCEVSGITLQSDGIAATRGVALNGQRAHAHHLIARDIKDEAIHQLGATTYRDLRVEHNGLYNVGWGIKLNRTPGVQVLDNYGDGFVENMITFWITDDPGETISDVVVRGNRGTGLGRMLVEFFSASAGVWMFGAPEIEDNHGAWAVANGTHDEFGISATSCYRPRVLRNGVIKTGAPTQVPTYWGIELAHAPGAEVALNYIEGFEWGVTPNDSHDAHLHHNWMRLCIKGISEANGSTGGNYHDNVIEDWRDTAIDAPYKGRSVDNDLRRRVTWPDDVGRTLVGIAANAQGEAMELEHNDIWLDQAVPSVAGFAALQLNGTSNARLAMRRHRLRTSATTPFGTGIVPNAGQASITGALLEQNTFENLAADSLHDIWTTNLHRTWGNEKINVTTQRLPNGSYLYPFQGSHTSGDRPLANAVIPGSFYFDSTLGIPIWSDGTNWVDATGTTV